MNEVLQIIGSIASILGVPLAVYLYLRSQVEKYAQVRREIVKRLSHQIGEGRAVGLFEARAVIDSLVRENRLRTGSITANSIIEDLIAETVSSPLLESSRKEILISELSSIHSIGQIFHAISSDKATFEKFLDFLKIESGDEDGTAKIRQEIESAYTESKRLLKTPELFGLLSVLLSIAIGTIALGLSVSPATDKWAWLASMFDDSLLNNLSIGAVASSLAAFILWLISELAGLFRRK